MTMNQRIISVVNDLAPCYPWEAYEGSGDKSLSRYFVFNYDVYPHEFGDDTTPYERYSIQLHYFCPLADDTVAFRKDIRKRIYTADFTWPMETNASDNDGQHYCWEFDGLEAVNGED
ncbi:MAG: hypothetical protein LUD25_05425 [Coriobacteriaceae bacterium]|nr:hypothetical protein [Coriobacteriaceae bacterium]